METFEHANIFCTLKFFLKSCIAHVWICVGLVTIIGELYKITVHNLLKDTILLHVTDVQYHSLYYLLITILNLLIRG